MGSSAEDRATTAEPTDRPDILASGRTANALAYGGAIGGGVLVIVGVALLGAGAAKNKKAKSTALRPRVSPRFGGLEVTF